MPPKKTSVVVTEETAQSHLPNPNLPSWLRGIDSYLGNRVGLLITVLFVMLAAIGMGELSRIQSSARTTPILQEVKRTSDAIFDTIDPGGTRYERNQKAQTAVVQSLNEISVYAAYCAKRHNELVDVQGCVRAEYLKAHPPEEGSPVP